MSVRRFFITLESCPHLNGKHTIFGHLVSGQETLERIAKVDVDGNDRPLQPVLIARCGELERKKKAPAHASAIESADSNERGRKDHRRRASASRSPSRTAPRTETRTIRPARRESDAVVDETLRGRPRARSHSHSSSRRTRSVNSQAISSSRSPAPKHKRKRSRSPSRRRSRNRETDVGGHEDRRRRRSLPNQYYEDGYGRRREVRHRDRDLSLIHI